MDITTDESLYYPEQETASLEISPGALDEVQQLWGSLFFSTEHNAPKSVVITGAQPGEGATEIAVALALVGSSSEHGKHIALLEFNARDPRVAGLLGVPPSPGIYDVLNGKEALYAASTVRCHGRLTVIPAGTGQSAAPPGLNRDRLANLIGELLEQHDHVLIDAPAVNVNAAAQALGAITDGVLLVTRAGATRREAIAEAKKRIELAQGRLIGLVLNMRTFPVPGWLYRRM
jgi:polysaccharide biosynthesis transport protein